MDFEELLAAAHREEMGGWDFSRFGERLVEQAPSWDYHRLVMGRLRQASSLLDMGTGGGEFLSQLTPLPAYTAATEGWSPNVAIARDRLAPLGVEVCEITEEQSEALPFDDNTFDLVINRHEYYVPSEVARVLRPGGRFITQQVGGDQMVELNQALDSERGVGDWNLSIAAAQVREAGMTITDSGEEAKAGWFTDVGAIVQYLRMCPWQLHVEYDSHRQRFAPGLRRLHEQIVQQGHFEFRAPRFFLVARAEG